MKVEISGATYKDTKLKRADLSLRIDGELVAGVTSTHNHNEEDALLIALGRLTDAIRSGALCNSGCDSGSNYVKDDDA